MLFQIYSDLHITKNKYLPKLYKYSDYLILNGDIGKLNDKNYQKFIKYISKTWKKIFYIPGNHEFYEKDDIYELINKYELFFSKFKNIIFMYNKTYELKNYYFIGTTLWSNPTKNFFKNHYNERLSIKKNNKIEVLQRNDYIKLYKECLTFLNSIKTNKKVILITHFPLIQYNTINRHYSPNKDVDSYSANVIDFTKLPFYKNLKCVISGHTHNSYDFIYKNVRFFSNQYGYIVDSNYFSMEGVCKL